MTLYIKHTLTALMVINSAHDHSRAALLSLNNETPGQLNNLGQRSNDKPRGQLLSEGTHPSQCQVRRNVTSRITSKPGCASLDSVDRKRQEPRSHPPGLHRQTGYQENK